MRSPPAAAVRLGRLGRLGRWWLDQSVRAKGMIVVAVPLIALVGVASASLTLQYKERQGRAAAITAPALDVAAPQGTAVPLNAAERIGAGPAQREPLVAAATASTA